MSLRAEMVTVFRSDRRGSERRVLDEVSIEVRTGVLTCLVGPNGAGKSSVLRVLAGLWPVDQGDVLLDGEPVAGLARRRFARHVAFVPQEARLELAFTVAEVVAMGRYPHEGRIFRSRPHPAVTDALRRTDVAGLADRLVTTLSGGERQRVLLARCLATEADLLLLDEPTANLDIRHALEVMSLCRSLADEGKGVCVAMHDLDAAIRFADEVAVMSAGRLAALGAPCEVLSPARVEEVFGVRAEVLPDSEGRPLLRFHPAGKGSSLSTGASPSR